MANTASILLPAVQPSAAVEVGAGSGWAFYTRVFVSGPSNSTTVHRGESRRGPRGALARDHIDAEVEANEDYRDPEVSTQSRQQHRQWGPWSLTQRELEVLQLLAEGATNGEISRRLYISPKTTKNHLAAIFQKLDVTNRTHALVRAVVMGLVTIE